MRQMQKRKGYATALSKRRWQRKAYGDIRAAIFRMYKYTEEQKRRVADIEAEAAKRKAEKDAAAAKAR